MAVVTAIKRQGRVGSSRFNISLDGKYAFSLSDLDLSNSGLRVGQVVTPADVDEYTKTASQAKAYGLALRYIGLRLRSRRELVDYLVRKNFDMNEIETVVERLAQLNLINDMKFAEAWIADRMAIRPRSRIRLAQELAAKGVGREDIDLALSAVEPDRELTSLKTMIERKKRSSGYSDEKKLIAYLQRQGYRWSVIKEALNQMEGAD
jgi:regulatory protein